MKKLVFIALLALVTLGQAQLAAGHERFLGNIKTAALDEDFIRYWNQITPEDAGKWGSVEAQRGTMVWVVLDRIFDYGRTHGMPVKFHTLVWGQQEPRWVAALPPEEQRAEVEEWFRAVAERFPDVAMIDVVNEPLHHPPSYKEALGGAGETGWDWVIWSFEQARQHFPNARLLLNEFNILCCADNLERYMELARLLQERGLIDGIAEQGHGFERADPAVIARNLDTLAELGLPIYISELCLNTADDNLQLQLYQNFFPIFWEHPAVAGVTLWGYKAGEIWRPNAFLIDWLGEERAALQWLREYLNPAQPIAARVAELLGRMTLAEKVGQMTQVNVTRLMGTGEWDRGPLNEYWLRRILVDNHVGSLLSGGGAAPVPNHPAAWAEFTNTLQRYALDTRLGIPLIYGTDAVHGHNNVVGATIYPHNIGLAAAWDPALVEEIAVRTARDVRATGIHWNFAPVADLGRDPRWGRFYETFGEDPLLASELVAASVRGLQSEGRVAATVKHFIGYGQASTGLDRAPAFIPPRTLRDTHLPPFAAGIQAGALTVMANSGSVNAVPVHASHYLLTEVLRGELGFTGVVVSDWNDIEKLVTVHRVAATFADAVAMSINAGVDMYMVPHDADSFTRTLLELVEDGVVPEARIDEAVTRILTLKMTLGLFEDPFTTAAEAAAIIEVDRDLAHRAAAASITLLENDGTLPLEGPATILVMGPAAADLAMQMGGWTIGWQGIERRTEMPPGVTVVQGLQAAAAEGVTVKHLQDTRDAAAVQAAADEADVVVVVLGEAPYAEGYGDSTSLALPAEQLTLVHTAAASGTPVVVVLFAGRPLVFPAEFWQAANAVVMAYLPGSEGGTAVADVLYGTHNPAGRLPFTWPRSVGQLPLTYDALPGPQTPEPLFSFGHGLSYTRFALGRVEAELTSGAIALHFEVANTGERAGSKVVPVFLERPPLPVMVPARQLVGFTRVTLNPGERQGLTIDIPLTHLSVIPGDALDDAAPTVLPGVYTLHVEGMQVRVTLP